VPETARLSIEPVRESDGPALIAANLASIEAHEPWVSPCRDQASFLAYLASCDGSRKVGFVARERSSGRIAGVINLSEIVRGPLQSAYLGYYGVAGTLRRGYMREALTWVLDHGFSALGLHRIEANIQPGNEASLALVRSLRFRNEGYSPRYLRIGGEWRDHERWAILADEWLGDCAPG
jgi:[ribosomal protein S5]-alanine N-acetyltransferase